MVTVWVHGRLSPTTVNEKVDSDPFRNGFLGSETGNVDDKMEPKSELYIVRVLIWVKVENDMEKNPVFRKCFFKIEVICRASGPRV